MFSSIILNKVYEIIPLPIFIVNKNVEIVHCNKSALMLMQCNFDEFKTLPDFRGGAALHCINSSNDHGCCGKSDECKTCILRNSIIDSFKSINTFQKKLIINIYHDSKLKNVTALITTINLDMHFSLLLIENITELVKLQNLIPICSHCKQIRDDNKYWNTVEEYISTITGSDITHGICPDCLKSLYPNLSQDMLDSVKDKY